MNKQISIHAPVQGATEQQVQTKLLSLFQSTHPCRVRHFNRGWIPFIQISIHAPVQGATSSGHVIHRLPKHFNPRTRAGCDDTELGLYIKQQISIHAPVQGATSYFVQPKSVYFYFNPRTRAGCDAMERKCLN